MKPPLRPANEQQRLAALHRYHVLDTPPEQALDDLTSLATQICDTPISLIALVDQDRQWFKSRAGLFATETPRDVSFCGHTILQGGLLIVADATKDPRFADNPLVTGDPHVRFYAGAPLLAPGGEAVGTICVIDHVPRTLTEAQQAALLALSRQAIAHMELRRQARELAAKEQFLRTIIESEPECVKVIGRDGALLTMNRAGLDMIEANSFEEVSGQCVYPLVDPRDRPAFEELNARVFRGGTGTITFRIVGLKGTPRWMETHAAPLRDEAGQVTALLGITRDITERRRTEETLRASEDRYHQLFENCPIPLLVEDFSDVKARLDELKASGVTEFLPFLQAHPEVVRELTSRIKVVELNTAVLAVHRASSKEDLLDNLGLVFTEGTYQCMANEFAWLAEGKLSFEFEEDVRKVDGEPMRIISRLTVAPGCEHTLERVVVSLIDITARTRAVEALRENERILTALVSNLPGMVYRGLSHPDWVMTYVSDGCRAVTGYERDELEGNRVVTFEKLVHPDDRGWLSNKRLEALGSQASFNSEYRIATKQGEIRWVWERASGIFDAEGTLLGIEGFVQDVTERRKLEAQWLRAQRMESIGTLAGGIAHDLNNVLAPILLSLELLKMKFPDADDLDLIRTLESSARRGADLVRQVLTFARGVEGQRVTVNLVQMLADIETIVRDTFPKSIEFKLVRELDVWSVTGDPTQIHQVMLNLCVNARDAMPRGGRLTVSLENTVLDEVYAGMNPESKVGAYVVVKVTDNGGGIADGIRERIFEPFFTTKELGQGTGLGLSTSLAIVKSHAGFINLYSEVGKGSTFKVYLPANTSIGAAEETALELTGLPRGNGETVLVVDDEEGIRNVATKTLQRFGYRVLVAKHGAEAIAVFVQHAAKIDVVLTDMAMPVMDGPALIIALKTLDPGVRIIASSGLNANGGVAKALGAGVEHFVPKPYTAEAILSAISKILANR